MVIPLYYVAFGENLRKLRTARNLTQKELGERVGLSKAVVSKYENALGYPTLDVLMRIANFFGVTTDYLLGMKSQKVVNVSGLTSSQVNAVLQIIAEMKRANEETR